MINSVLYLSAFIAAFKGVQAGINLDSSQNVAIYWGQNSIDLTGTDGQQRLSYYCDNDDVDVFMLSFVTMFEGLGGYPETNFANAGNNCTTFDGTELLDCPQIADDIVTCQGLGKTILLSTGGGTYTEGGFTSEDAAVSMANLMWEVFGPVSDNSSVLRPFGTAVIDGFDFDFEDLEMSNMPAYANQLRSLYETDTSKTYYMTAAPQCVYPDEADGPMLDGTVYFDAIWVQFYNNGCGIDEFVEGDTTQYNFDFDTWDNWAKTVSLNPNVKVYLGVAGNTGAANSGSYEPASVVGEVIDYIISEGYTSFGGVMMWDASQVWDNTGFLSSVYAYLPSGTVTASSSTTSVTKTTSTSKTTSTTLITTTSSSATTTTSTPSTTTTTTSPSSTCPVSGASCSDDGAYACSGSSFGICVYGAWVFESCASGEVCVQDGSSVYCAASGSSDPVCA